MTNKLTQQLLAILFICFCITSCSGGATYWIDNPTDQVIEVFIDGKDAIKLDAKEYKRMDGALSLGEHTMKVGDGTEIKFNLDKDHITLNPTLSAYVVVIQEYGTGFASDESDTIIVIDGKKYEGPFPVLTNDPFIPTSSMNFLVDAPFKDEIQRSSGGTVVLKKLFRKDDFITYYNKEYR